MTNPPADAPKWKLWRENARETASRIEDAIAAHQLSAPEVFTQMRQLLMSAPRPDAAAPTAPQEPVAEVVWDAVKKQRVYIADEELPVGTKLYRAPPHAISRGAAPQEPCAWIDPECLKAMHQRGGWVASVVRQKYKNESRDYSTPLYTSPPSADRDAVTKVADDIEKWFGDGVKPDEWKLREWANSLRRALETGAAS